MATQNQPLASNPHWKAALATAAVFVLMAGAAGVAYWYGTQTTAESAKTVTTQNTNTAITPETSSPAPRVAFSGEISTVQNNSLELLDSATKKTLTIALNKDTSVRKLDFRTIPKEGVGEGVAMKTSELKTGQQVVVITADATTSPILAQKVSRVIYP